MMMMEHTIAIYRSHTITSITNQSKSLETNLSTAASVYTGQTKFYSHFPASWKVNS